MEFLIQQETLKRGLGIVSHAVAGKSTLPVLSNILISADRVDPFTKSGDVTLSATNLELAITYSLGIASNYTPGATTLPAKLVCDLVGTLPNDRVSLQLDERSHTTSITCGRVKSKIKGIDAEQFPSFPPAAEPVATFEAAALRAAISQVVPAAATDDGRPALTAVLMLIEGPGAVFTATDGFRLAVKSIALPEDGGTHQFLIPARSLAELARAITDESPAVTIAPTTSGGQVVFESGPLRMMTRIVEAGYPDYMRVIPPQHDTKITVNVKELYDAVKRASLFAASAGNVIKLATTVDGTLYLSTKAAEAGDNNEEIPAAIEGEGGSIALNVRYLLDALGCIRGDQVELELQTPERPCVLRQTGDRTYMHLVMPMSVAGGK